MRVRKDETMYDDSVDWRRRPRAALRWEINRSVKHFIINIFQKTLPKGIKMIFFFALLLIFYDIHNHVSFRFLTSFEAHFQEKIHYGDCVRVESWDLILMRLEWSFKSDILLKCPQQPIAFYESWKFFISSLSWLIVPIFPTKK